MSRQLRHLTIPSTHDRIRPMGEEGREQIRLADTEKLVKNIRWIAEKVGPILSDDMWRVWYEIEDELRERGEWNDDLGKTGKARA